MNVEIQPMRLTRQQQDAIRQTIAEADPQAHTFVFGSRADKTARGGDIARLCFSKKIDHQGRRKIQPTLQDRLGAQKVDFVVAQEESSPFVRLVLPKAIRLK